MDFSTIEITLENVRGNDVNSSTLKITSKKARGNDMDLSISKITSEKYVEITWLFIKSWSSRYLHNIDVDSMWCAHWDFNALFTEHFWMTVLDKIVFILLFIKKCSSL